MKILITAAHYFEIADFIKYLDDFCVKVSFFEYQKKDISIFPVILGHGVMQTSFGISRINGIESMDLLINAGTVTSVIPELELGETYHIYKEYLVDNGRFNKYKKFEDVFDLELMDANKFPFVEKSITNENFNDPLSLQMVVGGTMNVIPSTIGEFSNYPLNDKVDVISSEGVAIHYACKLLDLDFLHLRSVSRSLISQKTNLEKALANLNATLIEYLSYYSGDSIVE